MTTQHERLVKYTAMFIEKYGQIISDNVNCSGPTYCYNSSGTSNVYFRPNNETIYSFQIFPEDRKIKIHLNIPDVQEHLVYKTISSKFPFIKVDYKRIFEIFDFIKQDDQPLDSIKSFKRFNSMVSSLDESFNGVKVVYAITYNSFYKTINKRTKLNSQVDTYLHFDEEMNMIIYSTINISFSDRDFIDIEFNSFDDGYNVDEVYMNKEQMFEYIHKKRRAGILKNIKRSFKEIDFEINFDDHFKEHIQLLEMLHI